MTDAVAPVSLPRGAVRWRERLSPVLTLSVCAHLALLLALILGDGRRDPPLPREIPVELVEAPPPLAPKPPAPKPPAAQPKPPQASPKPPQASPKPPQASPKPPQAPPKPPQAPPKPPQAPPKPPQAARKPDPPPKPQRVERPKPPAAESVAERVDRLLGPMAAIPLPGVGAGGEESASYKQIVLSQVAKAKKVGRYRGVPGAASVGFTVADDGTLLRCEIVRKSVDPALDAEALAMVRRAAPFPPPPPGAEREYVIGLRFQAM